MHVNNITVHCAVFCVVLYYEVHVQLLYHELQGAIINNSAPMHVLKAVFGDFVLIIYLMVILYHTACLE